MDDVRSGGRLDARGASISAELLRAIVDGLPSDEEGLSVFPRGADFSQARFEGEADLRCVRFKGFTRFAEAQFGGKALFTQARFEGDTTFGEAEFSSDVSFGGAQFAGSSRFHNALFRGDADFRGAEASGYAGFGSAQFLGPAHFVEMQFGAKADFGEAIFKRSTVIGPIVVVGTLSFDKATFEQDARVDASAAQLTCCGTRFGARAELNLRWAETVLDDATLVGRSRVAGVTPFAGVDEGPLRPLDHRRHGDSRPRLVSLRQAGVENLALANVDLRACRFVGAAGLDQLRIEADCEFAQPPPDWRYTRRRMLGEEHEWQARHRGERDDGWHPEECRAPDWLEPETETLDPPRIASLYRALRKAFEDRKDEPGAADFYYGEMEMRRLGGGPDRRNAGSRFAGSLERGILWVYWAVAGYGLRASRAVAALLVTVLVFAAAFDAWGFDGQPFWRALLFSAQSTTSLFKTPEAPAPEPVGEALQLPLRLLGPLFFGLVLLSLRGRVKR